MGSNLFNDLQVFVGVANSSDIAGDTAQSRFMVTGFITDFYPKGIVYKGLVVFARIAHSNTSQAAQEHVIAGFKIQLGRTGIAFGNSDRVRHDNAITRDIRKRCIANITRKATCNGALNRNICNADTIDQRIGNHTCKGTRRVIIFTARTLATNNNAHAIKIDILYGHAICSFKQTHGFFCIRGDIAKVLNGLAFSIDHGAVDSRERHMVYIALTFFGCGGVFAQINIGAEFKGDTLVSRRFTSPVCFKHLSQVCGCSSLTGNATTGSDSAPQARSHGTRSSSSHRRTGLCLLAKNQRSGRSRAKDPARNLRFQVKIRGCSRIFCRSSKTHAGKRQHGKQKQTDFCFHKTLNYLLLSVKIP